MSQEIKKVITVETSEAVKSLDAVSQSTDRAGQSFKTLQEYENYVQSLTDKLASLTEGSEEYESVNKELTEAQSELNTEIEQTNETLSDTDSKIKDLKDKIPEYSKNVKNLGTSFKQVGQSAKGSEPFIKRATAAVKAFATATVVLKVFQVVMEAIRKLFERNTEASERLKKTLSKFEPVLKVIDKIFTSIVKIIADIADRYIPRIINALNKVFKFLNAYYQTIYQGGAKVLNSLNLVSDESYNKVKQSAEQARKEFKDSTDEISNYIITQSTKTVEELQKENEKYRQEIEKTGKSYDELSKRREEIEKLLELVKHNETWWRALRRELKWVTNMLNLFKKIKINDFIILLKSNIDDATGSISDLDKEIVNLTNNITSKQAELEGIDSTNHKDRKAKLEEIEKLEKNLYNKRVDRSKKLVEREIYNEQLKAAEKGDKIKEEEAQQMQSVKIQEGVLNKILLDYTKNHKTRLEQIETENKAIKAQKEQEDYKNSELYNHEQEYNKGIAQNTIDQYILEQKLADVRKEASNTTGKSVSHIISDFTKLGDVTKEYYDVLINTAELEYNLAVERAKYRGEDITESKEVAEAWIKLDTVKKAAADTDREIRKELGQTVRSSKDEAKKFVEEFIGNTDTLSDKIHQVEDDFNKAVNALREGGGIRVIEELEEARDKKIGTLWLEDVQKKIQEINDETSFKLQFIDPNDWEQQNRILDESIRKQLELWQTLREQGVLTEEQFKLVDNTIKTLTNSLEELGKSGATGAFFTKVSKEWEEATKKAQAVTADIQTVNESIAGLADAIGSYYEEEIKQRLEAGEISEEEAEKEFERVKGVQIAAAIIQGLSGAATAVAQAMSLGPIVGPIVGALNAATVLTNTALQVKQIKATKIGSDSISTAVPKSNITEYKPEYTSSVTGLSEEERLSDIYKKGLEQSDIRVYVLESDITNAQNKKKAKVSESSF